MFYPEAKNRKIVIRRFFVVGLYLPERCAKRRQVDKTPVLSSVRRNERGTDRGSTDARAPDGVAPKNEKTPRFRICLLAERFLCFRMGAPVLTV